MALAVPQPPSAGLAARSDALIVRPHDLHRVWTSLEFVVNALLFVLAGALVGDACVDHGDSDTASVIGARDYGYLVLVWLLALAARRGWARAAVSTGDSAATVPPT